MPAQSTQAIVDGASSPVTHNFAPQGAMFNAGEMVATWLNRAASVLTGGAHRLTVYFRTKKEGALSYRVSLIIPITENLSGYQTVTRTLRYTGTFEIPADATLQNRKDILAMAASALASTSNLGVALTNGEGVW